MSSKNTNRQYRHQPRKKAAISNMPRESSSKTRDGNIEKKFHKWGHYDDEEDSVTAPPSSSGTLGSSSTTPIHSPTSTTAAPGSPPLLQQRPRQLSCTTTPTGISLGGRIRKRISIMRNRRAAKERRATRIERAEQQEGLHQTKLQIVFKNPTLFRAFKERVRNAGCFTPVGVRFVLRQFLSEMKVVDLLEDLRIEQDTTEEEDQPRRGLGIFASFGYGRTSTTSTTTKGSRTSSKPGSGRHFEIDDQSILSLESIGLSLPSLDHADEQEGDSDDCSSVDTMSTGWSSVNHQHIHHQHSPPRQSSLRSLESSRQGSLRSIYDDAPMSGRSLLGISTQEEDESMEDD